MNTKRTVFLDGKNLTIEDVINIAEKNDNEVDYSDKVWEEISKFREGLEKRIYDNPQDLIYGVTVGCGDLLHTPLKKKEWEEYIGAWESHKGDPKDHQKEQNRKKFFKEYLIALEDYQKRYIKAHNCGTGDPFPKEVVRAAMVIRLNSFAKGHSAIRSETAQLMINMLNRGVTPWVLKEGSVGASGDLVPLAMIGAAMIGLPDAKAYYNNEDMSASVALEKAALKPTKLAAKEAMALTNGSTFITALAIFAIRDTEILLKNASISAALSLEAIRGEKTAFSENIANVRPHKGHKIVAEQIRKLLNDSKRIEKDAKEIPFEKYKQDPNTAKQRIQDRYSFRCVPQVHGAVYEANEKLKEIVTIEINSATDNPLFFEVSEGNYQFESESGGNFHGQPLAVVIDYLKLALTGLALITNKRTFSMLDKAQN